MTDLASALDTAIGALNEVRRAYTAENFDESLVRREHGRFARQDGDGPRPWADRPSEGRVRQLSPRRLFDARDRYRSSAEVRVRLAAAFPNAEILGGTIGTEIPGWSEIRDMETEFLSGNVDPDSPEWEEVIQEAEQTADRVVAVYDGLEQMAGQFPDIAARITTIEMTDGLLPSGGDAETNQGPGVYREGEQFSPPTAKMTFSLGSILNTTSTSSFSVSGGEAQSENDMRRWTFGMAVHEFAHVLDHYAAIVEHGAEFSHDDFSAFMFHQSNAPKLIAAWDDEFPDHFNLAAGDVSTYAMSEPAEYAAEAFTLSRLDPDALPDDARDIVEWIEARAAMQVGDRVPVLAAAGAHLDPDGTPTLLIVDMLHGDCIPVRYALGMLGQRPNTAAIAGPAEIIREIPDKFAGQDHDDEEDEAKPRRAFAEDQERDYHGRWVNEPGRGDDAPKADEKPGKTPDAKKEDRPPGTLTKKGVVCGDGSVVKIGDKVAVTTERGLSFDRFKSTGYGKAVSINEVGGIGVKFDDGSRRYYPPEDVSTGPTKIGKVDEGKVDSVLFGDKEYTEEDFDALLELAPQVFGGGEKPEHGLDLGKGDIGDLAKAFGASVSRRAFAEFDETKHPRGERGKFTFKEPAAESPVARDYAITDPVPPEPGTTPIPEGYVRFYHYTRIPEDDRPVEERLHAAAESLRTGGLRLSDAKGETYGEPNMVWASAERPDPNESVFAEFAVPMGDPRWIVGNSMEISPDSTYAGKYVAPDGKAYNTSPDYFAQRGSNVAFNADIRPDEIISVNEPWHAAYRYFADSPESVANVLAGDHDNLLDDPRYGPAIRRIKADGGIQAAAIRRAAFDETLHPRDSVGRFSAGFGTMFFERTVSDSDEAGMRRRLTAWAADDPKGTMYSAMNHDELAQARSSGLFGTPARGLWVSNNAGTEYLRGDHDVMVALRVEPGEFKAGGHGGDFNVAQIPADRVVDVLDTRQAALRAYVEFIESEHPRGEHGRFAFKDEPGREPERLSPLDDAVKRMVMGGSGGEMAYAALFASQGMTEPEWRAREGNAVWVTQDWQAAQTLMAAIPDAPREPVLYRGIIDLAGDKRGDVPLEVGRTYTEPLASWSTEPELADDFRSGKYASVSSRPTSAVRVMVENAPAINAPLVDPRERITGGTYRVTNVEPVGMVDIESAWNPSFVGKPGPWYPDTERDGKAYYTGVPSYDVTVEWQPTQQAALSRFARRAYVFDEEAHPRGEHGRFTDKGGDDAHAADYGLHYDAAYVNDPDLAAAKQWDGWDQVPVTQVDPHTLVAVEDKLSRRSIDKVVNGDEPLREGYVVRVVRKDDGTEIIVDGHHRAAMASAMDRPLDVKVADAAEVRGTRRAYTAENFDESLVRREHGRFARQDDGRDFEAVYPKDAIAEPYCADPDYSSAHPCMGAAAAHKYQTEWGASVANSFLRAGTPRLPTGVTDRSAIEAWTNPARVEQFVADMDSAMSPSSADTMIYRGFVERNGEGFEVGDRFIDKGYTSGSNLDTWALEFANGRRDGNILGEPVDKVPGTPKIMEIEVPEGTPSMKGAEYVEEFILGRGGEYEVREVLPDGYRVRRVA